MISEPFELLRLPKASARNKYNDTIIVGDELLFVGVSSSFISTLSLRPPQVLSAHSVPPGTVITAILSSDTDLLGYATKERNKYFIKLLQNDGSSGTKGVISKEVKEEISNLILCNGSHLLAAVGSHSSQLTGYSTTDLTEIWTDLEEPRGELLFSTVADSPGQSETICIIVSQSSDGLNVRTAEVSGSHVRTLMNAKISDEQSTSPVSSKSFFSFSPSMHLLYHLRDQHVIVYTLPSASVHSSFELGPGAEISGMLSLPHNNIAVARGNNIELIDCNFRSKISSKLLPGTSSTRLLAFSPSASAIAVSQGDEVILGLTVTPTKGTLFESLGTRADAQQERYEFADIFDGFTDRPQEYRTTALSQINKAKNELQAVLKSLEGASKARNGAAFAEVVTYLKDPSLNWVEWHESGNASAPEAQDLVYVDSDRNADSELIRAVAELAFLPKYQSFLPQGVAVYLLTHPLFPYGEPKFANLLRSLEKSHPLLYRQAIVSLPGITVKDLVLALLNRDEHTFLEAVVRLQEDFGAQQILNAIREAFSEARSLGSLTIIVDRLSRYPEALALIVPFIDAIGLLAWKPEHISQLRGRLDRQILAVQSAAKSDAAIVDLCQSIGLDLLAGDAVPSETELQKRQQRSKQTEPAPRTERTIPRYSIETLTL